MKAVYLESSAIGRAFVHGDGEAYAAVRSAMRGRTSVTSELTLTELNRAWARAEVEHLVTAAQAAEGRRKVGALLTRCHIVALDSTILIRAGEAFPAEPVRTLDAIHLATALNWEREVGGELAVCTRDRRVTENAVALGFKLL
jgi:hypothetical protein